MSFVWDHFNYHVTDMKKSVEFYQKAFGMKVIREMGSPEGPVHFVMLGYDNEKVVLELKWDKSHEGKYDTGDRSYHFCVKTDKIEEALELYRSMGVITQEMNGHGCFIQDPDGYLVEILSL